MSSSTEVFSARNSKILIHSGFRVYGGKLNRSRVTSVINENSASESTSPNSDNAISNARFPPYRNRPVSAAFYDSVTVRFSAHGIANYFITPGNNWVKSLPITRSKREISTVNLSPLLRSISLFLVFCPPFSKCKTSRICRLRIEYAGNVERL